MTPKFIPRLCPTLYAFEAILPMVSEVLLVLPKVSATLFVAEVALPIVSLTVELFTLLVPFVELWLVPVVVPSVFPLVKLPEAIKLMPPEPATLVPWDSLEFVPSVELSLSPKLSPVLSVCELESVTAVPSEFV